MWLVSKADTGLLAPGIRFAAGERVLVEVSRKYTPSGLQCLAYDSGFYLQVSQRIPACHLQHPAFKLPIDASRAVSLLDRVCDREVVDQAQSAKAQLRHHGLWLRV